MKETCNAHKHKSKRGTASNKVCSPELIDILAKKVHNTWAYGRMEEGWTYGAARDDNAKTTPCFLPYDELSETEKNYDRRTVLATLEGIIELGYRITKEG